MATRLFPRTTRVYLRRPLLITGKPGSGKTTLASAVARELGLGPVLRWSITSRSALQDGLYQYDAVARLQDIEWQRWARARAEPTDIGRYLTLGPLGTAFYGTPDPERPDACFPHVLLIDEIDKSDIDLPNDLLHVLEEGRFEIPELVRLKQQQPRVAVRDWGVGAADCPIEVERPSIHVGFRIARYPVTNAQFQAFIDAGGYRRTAGSKGLLARLRSVWGRAAVTADWWLDLEGHEPVRSRWPQPNRPRTDLDWCEALAPRTLRAPTTGAGTCRPDAMTAGAFGWYGPGRPAGLDHAQAKRREESRSQSPRRYNRSFDR